MSVPPAFKNCTSTRTTLEHIPRPSEGTFAHDRGGSAQNMQLVRKTLVNSSAPIPFVSSARVTINQHNFTASRGAATACAGGARAFESQLHQTRFAGGNLWARFAP